VFCHPEDGRRPDEGSLVEGPSASLRVTDQKTRMDIRQKMRRKRHCGYFVVILLAMVSLCPPAEARQVVDRVIAVVDDEVITQSELDQLLFPVYDQYRTLFKRGQFIAKMSEARQALLNQLIEDKLVYAEAKRKGVRVTQEEIEARVRDFRARFGNDGEFGKILADQGLTLSKLKTRYEEQIAIRKLHQYEVRSRIIVTPKEIEEYYRSHLEEFSQAEKIKVKSISIRKSEQAVEAGLPDEKARAELERILSLAYQGTDFSELAKTYSEDVKAFEGGELGYITRGELVDEIDQVLFSLKTEDISPILETELGYHLFKVEERIESQVKRLEEVRETVHEILFRKKAEERFLEWVSELKKNAYISIR
jgi:parvulin-like peptidyl-prolyl isomerase